MVKGSLKRSPKESKIRNKENRSGHYQKKFGGEIAKKEGKTEGYHGGHIIGSVFMGPAEKINIVPQLASQNMRGGLA
ncbi:hypothetical protein C0W35_22010 [Photobacterium kishitanii]|uniref:DNA/RNA non-specific endonuclease n=1 Tax=Photobacterium kishitanii TaxID=318456 RepID=UPI000D165898|nr:DNA/RNA non-specific endonuclease [Photobacterium kishitanii]PSU86788.1 hypothetical protein C0W35_22010 [Photobacterium kishitanii]